MGQRRSVIGLCFSAGAGAALALILVSPLLFRSNGTAAPGILLQGTEIGATNIDDAFMFDAVSMRLAEGRVEFMGAIRTGNRLVKAPDSVSYEILRRGDGEYFESLSKGTLAKTKGRFELTIAPKYLRETKLLVVIRK